MDSLLITAGARCSGRVPVDLRVLIRRLIAHRVRVRAIDALSLHPAMRPATNIKADRFMSAFL
jgi:hypothetical protein